MLGHRQTDKYTNTHRESCSQTCYDMHMPGHTHTKRERETDRYTNS